MGNLKFIFVFLVFAGLISCSSDDDSNGPAEADRIVGEWKIESLSMDGEELDLTDCELQTRIRFSTNGDISVTDYYEDFDSEECISEVYTQKWENRGDNVYRI
ncbi:MAG TPA: lipocalin family protein, partial [Gillisia sp.]|nr:lipocalin family protein [Gillisia sp.]